MPKRKEPELDPKEQFKRFKEAAKEAGVDSEIAEHAFRQLGTKEGNSFPGARSKRAAKPQ